MDTDKLDHFIFDLLPSEIWALIISYLPRITRHSLEKIEGFRELIENVTLLEDKKLYHALKIGNKLEWKRVDIPAGQTIQPRLKHGTINFEDNLVIFGGASSNQRTTGQYNDVWNYNNFQKFRRMATSSSTVPSPKANFGYVQAGSKILVVGGKSLIQDSPFALSSTFELHSLNPVNGVWQKILTTGNEPEFFNGIRCIMLNNLELLTVAGLIPTFHHWDSMQAELSAQHRTSMQICILKFTNETYERGHWHTLADFQVRRGYPPPRTESHLVNLGNDCVLMFGGRSITNSLQDAWIMKITRTPSYNLKWHQVGIHNPLVPALPTHIFPSCLINDILVFTGVRTSLMKKPEAQKSKSNSESPKAPATSPQPTSSATTSSSIVSSSPPSSTQQKFSSQAEMRRIFINTERPLNTIGAMSAFSVPSPVPQKVLKMQVSPEIVPEPPPKKILQDYPMRIFCLDLSRIMNCTDEILRGRPGIRWLILKNGGLFRNAPELRAHATFTNLDSGIALIGGVKRSQTDDDVLFTQATNEVFMLDYCNDEI